MNVFNRGIKIKSPKKFEDVGGNFVVSGSVSRDWLKSDTGYRNVISIEMYDINAQLIMGGNVILENSINEIEKSDSKRFFDFMYIFQFHFDSGLKESHGCMNIRLKGWKDESQSIFIPINVKFFEPKNGLDKEVIKKHKKVGKIVTKFEKDSVIYHKKLNQIYESRQKKTYRGDEKDTYAQYLSLSEEGNWKILGDILNIFENENDENNVSKYTFSKEDKEEKKLKEKYKDLIEWLGPLCGATIGNMDGFKFMIHSHDHDKHFHVIHKGRRVDARFSFPDIELISYKNAHNYISSKEKSRISDYFKVPENFKILEAEFTRRELSLS